MERIINYTLGIDEMHPKSPQYAGVQGEHRATAIALVFDEKFAEKLEEQKHFWDTIQFRIDYTDSLGNVLHGETYDISEIANPFYLTRVMTKWGGNSSAVLKILCFNEGGTQKEFYTGIMRFYFDSCPSVILAEEEEGSVLSPIVNQARNYRNEAYDSARVSLEAEDMIKTLTEENRALNENTNESAQVIIKASQKFHEMEEKLDDANEILEQCQEAASLAENATKGVVTIEQNKNLPLKFSVMTSQEYENAQRPDPDGCVTLDIIEDENWVDYIYPVGSIYMSVNDTEPSNLFGGAWERIKDRFLLSCGDIYEANSVGGEAEHILQSEEMPSHSHGIVSGENYLLASTGSVDRTTVAQGTEKTNILTSADGVIRATQNTYASGSGKAHNNMPPYMAVYMWKRIA